MNEELAGIVAVAGMVPEGPFLVAVGGGADSAVAAALVKEVAAGSGVRLIHLDHRTSASALLADAVVRLAAHLELPLEMRPIEIERTGSWEAAAREARRRALCDALLGSETIVTGHHRDDVAETIVAHMARGAGARGLSSLRGRAGCYWRPLIATPRSELRRVADAVGLPYADDPSNRDLRHRRNLIRHEIMPVLGSLNPRVGEALARAAQHLGEDDAVLEAMAAGVPIARDGEAWVVPLPLLATLPRPVGSRAVAAAIRLARPPYGPSASELSRISDVVSGAARRTELADGLIVEAEGPMLAVYRQGDVPVPPSPVELAVPGAVRFGLHRIDSRLTAGPVRAAGTVSLDASEVRPPLLVRAAEHGERLTIRSGSKLVRDALAEAGVPVRKRAGWPVVVAHGKIAWIAGVRAASWARFHATTRQCLVLGWGG